MKPETITSNHDATTQTASNKKRKGPPSPRDHQQSSSETELTPLEHEAKQYIIASFKQPLKSPRYLWDTLSPAWKVNRDVALAAVHHEIASVEEIGEEFSSDEGFLKELLTLNVSLYESALRQARQNVPLAMLAAGRLLEAYNARMEEDDDDGCGVELVVDLQNILEICPEVKESEEFWEATLGVQADGDARDPAIAFLLDNCPDLFLQSVDFMVKVCTMWPFVLHFGNISRSNPDLFEDEAFLRLLLPKQPRALLYVAKPAQLKVPDLVKEILASNVKLFQDEKVMIRPSWVAEELWDDDAFVRTFVLAGGNPFEFSAKWRLQPDLVLWVLDNTPVESRISICLVDQDLRDDKDFMVQAVVACPSIFLLATKRITNDNDVFLLFLANASESCCSCLA